MEGEATSFAAKNEPWIQSTFSGFGGGIRRHDQERLIVWVNYVSAGVVPGKKLVFTLEHVTQLLHALPRTAAAVILLPNRASDLRNSPKNLVLLLISKNFFLLFFTRYKTFFLLLSMCTSIPIRKDGDFKADMDEEDDTTVKKQEGHSVLDFGKHYISSTKCYSSPIRRKMVLPPNEKNQEVTLKVEMNHMDWMTMMELLLRTHQLMQS